MEFRNLSKNKNLDLGLITKFIDKPWSRTYLKKYHDLDYQEIVDGTSKKVIYYELSRKPDLDYRDVAFTIKSKWDWKYLSKRSDLDLNLVIRNYNKNWDWEYLINRKEYLICLQ